LESKAFQGRTGSAFLFGSVINVTEGETKEKDFTTGRHVVTMIYCKFCNNKLGWKYVRTKSRKEVADSFLKFHRFSSLSFDNSTVESGSSGSTLQRRQNFAGEGIDEEGEIQFPERHWWRPCAGF
jgi:hypothetical protein